MKDFPSIVAIILISFFLASCATNNHVASEGLIQKRKYTKGFHLQLGVTSKGAKKSQELTNYNSSPFDHSSNQAVTEDLNVFESVKTRSLPKLNKPALEKVKQAHNANMEHAKSLKDVYRNQVELHKNVREAFEPTDGIEEENRSEKMPGATIAAFVLSIIGLFVIAFIAGTLAIILGSMGLAKSLKTEEKRGSGLAVLSIALGVLDIILWAIVLATIL